MLSNPASASPPLLLEVSPGLPLLSAKPVSRRSLARAAPERRGLRSTCGFAGSTPHCFTRLLVNLLPLFPHGRQGVALLVQCLLESTHERQLARVSAGICHPYGLVWLYPRTRTNRCLVIQLEAYDQKVGSKPTLNRHARASWTDSEALRALLSEMDMGFI